MTERFAFDWFLYELRAIYFSGENKQSCSVQVLIFVFFSKNIKYFYLKFLTYTNISKTDL